jgi:CheY-like chemotaxis protein
MVRSDSRYADVPIVVLSGNSSPDTPERVRLLGANAFFAKPYSPVKVLETLETLLDGT